MESEKGSDIRITPRKKKLRKVSPLETTKKVIPIKPLSKLDLEYYVVILKIPNVRGIYMRNTLSKHPLETECGILNLDTEKILGTHWTCWDKKDNICYYFDY